MQLGPGVCVARVPKNGRNFEYLSGEDPYLGYKLVQDAIMVSSLRVLLQMLSIMSITIKKQIAEVLVRT